MAKIDIFYQLEGIADIGHYELDADEAFTALKAHLCKKHGIVGELLIFLEDNEEPIQEIILVREHAHQHGIKVHVHRCLHVEVSVRFNSETLHHRFAPGVTVARVKSWAAKKLGMSADDATEHVLQITGTHDRPKPGTHIGTLTKCPHCRVAFDLVPDERVNGHSHEEGVE